MFISSFYSTLAFRFAALSWFMFFLSFIGLRAVAETYYSNSSGFANQKTTWNSNIDGTGTQPSNFSTEGDIFILIAESNLDLDGSWIIGSGVTLQIDGYLSITGQSHDITINGTVDFTKTDITQVSLIGGGDGNNFTLGPNATLKTANGSGIWGSNCSLPPAKVGTTITLPPTANYELTGSNQTTLGLPKTVNNLTFSGSGTKTLNDALTIKGTLTIKSNVTLATVSHPLTFFGDFVNHGTLVAESSNIVISGTSNQKIEGFSTTGTVSMTKTGGIATLEGDVNGDDLKINGLGGAIHLGAGLTHIFTGPWIMTNGTVNGGSSTLRLGGTLSGTGGIFTAGEGTVEYNKITSQGIYAVAYHHLIISGGGTKTLTGALTIKGTLTISSNVTLATVSHPLTFFGDFVNHGTLLAESSNIVISGSSTQNIGGFSTTGTVSMTKIGGIATLEGNVNGNNLTINGLSGTLHLGSGLTHTFINTYPSISSWTMTNGTVDGGSSTLRIGGLSSRTEGIFRAGEGTVEYYETSAQSVSPFNYHHLILSGGGPKSLQLGTTTISGNLTLSGTASTTTMVGLTIGGNLSICNGAIFKVAGHPLTVNGTTEISGNLTISSTVGSKFFSGLVTIEPGGSWTNNSHSPVEFAGGITNNGTFKAGTGVHTFIANDQVLSGNLSIGSITITEATVVNKNSLTVTMELTGSGSLIQGVNAILNIGGTSTISTLTAIAPNNTVNFSSFAPQSIPGITYCNLTTSGTGTKTIPAGSAVTVNGTLATTGLLAINSDVSHSGSLIVKGTSSGDVTYNRWMDATRWYITSSPVKTTNFGTLHASKISRDGTLYDFAPYLEPENAGWNYQSSMPSDLAVGKGYLISLASPGEIQFKGLLNDGDVPSPVTASTYNGWNAVGNPYTSAIQITGPGGFLDVNTLSGMLSPEYAAIYIWNEDEDGYSGNEQYYKAIGNSGYIYTPQNSGGNPIAGPTIQAGQGFMIRANTSGDLLFTRAMQVHQPTLSLKSADVSWPGITLLADSHGQTRSTVVAFNEQMTTGLDVSYDAGLLATDDFQVYTHLVEEGNAVDFAIQCLPDKVYTKLSVPVGVDLPEGGNLAFKAVGVILPDGLYPVIEDRELGIKMALRNEADSYTVTIDKNTTGTGRFYLSFDGVALGSSPIQPPHKLTASFVNNRLVIHGSVESGTKALLFDICGRKVGEYPLYNTNRNEIAITNLNQRIYLLKIQSRNTSQSIKLIAVNTLY